MRVDFKHESRIKRLWARLSHSRRSSGALHRAHAAELGFYVAGYYGKAKFDGVDKARFDDYATYDLSFYGFTPEQTDSTLGDDKDASIGMAAVIGSSRTWPSKAATSTWAK